MARPKIKRNPLQAKRMEDLLRIEGLTAAGLSKVTGIAQNQICDIRAGRANMSKTVVELICNAFNNINPKWLTGESDEYYRPSIARDVLNEQGFRFSQREKEIFENFLSLSGYLIQMNPGKEYKDKDGCMRFESPTYSIYYKGKEIKKLNEEELDVIYIIARETRRHATLSFSDAFDIPFIEK